MRDRTSCAWQAVERIAKAGGLKLLKGMQKYGAQVIRSTAGELLTMQLIARDRFHNVCERGGEPFTAEVRPVLAAEMSSVLLPDQAPLAAPPSPEPVEVVEGYVVDSDKEG